MEDSDHNSKTMEDTKIHGYRAKLLEQWLNDDTLHDYAVNVVGINDELEEQELENAFFYLTMWIKGSLTDAHIVELMEHEEGNTCQGKIVVLRHMMKGFPELNVVDIIKKQATVEPTTDLF